MKEKCLICNKEIQVNFFGKKKGEFITSYNYICDNCIPNVPSIKNWNPVLQDSQREEIKNDINNELIKAGYSEDIIKRVNDEIQKSDDEHLSLRNYNAMSEEEREERIEKGREEREKLAKNHICTNSFNIEGYRITKYIQVVTEEVVVGTGAASSISSSVGDFIGGEIPSYSNKMAIARETATKRAIYKSALLGGNALIGVTVNYVTFDKDVIGASVTGTSVTIEPIEVGDTTEESK